MEDVNLLSLLKGFMPVQPLMCWVHTQGFKLICGYYFVIQDEKHVI